MAVGPGGEECTRRRDAGLGGPWAGARDPGRAA